jgi:hypothetical protein
MTKMEQAIANIDSAKTHLRGAIANIESLNNQDTDKEIDYRAALKLLELSESALELLELRANTKDEDIKKLVNLLIRAKDATAQDWKSLLGEVKDAIKIAGY